MDSVKNELGKSMKFDAVFISPHLDDAVLSCGGVIAGLVQQQKQVCVVTVFTTGNTDNLSADGKKFLRESGVKTVHSLFIKRKQEDIAALRILGCRYLHLPFVEGLFRASKRLAADVLIYPSYQQLFNGRISPADVALIAQLQSKLRAIKQSYSSSQTTIYAPLGVGNHVDHVMVAQAVVGVFGKDVYLWEDVPYRANPLHVFQRQLEFEPQFFKLKRKDLNILKNSSLKQKAVSLYESQLPGLHAAGLGSIDYAHEVFYEKRRD